MMHKTSENFCTLSTVALWTFKVMEVVPEDHMLLFFCIDYTIWPGAVLNRVHKLSELYINIKIILHKQSVKAFKTRLVSALDFTVPEDHTLLFFCIDYTIWPGAVLNRVHKLLEFEMQTVKPQALTSLYLDLATKITLFNAMEEFQKKNVGYIHMINGILSQNFTAITSQPNFWIPILYFHGHSS